MGAMSLVLATLTGCAALTSDEFTVNTEVCQRVHECTRTMATADYHVNFGPDTGYFPNCLIVADGASVTWASNDVSSINFGDVPLKGGVKPNEDPESLLNLDPPNKIDTQKVYVLSGACVFPFFSTVGGENFAGAVFIK